MKATLTPMMQQYQSIRSGLPENTLLLFRLGDFYEMFFEDAKEASGILNVALTKRNGTPMCGVPYHAADSYVAKLIKAGKRVAICDQVGLPQAGKIVEREITQIISPGTVNDGNLLEASRNNFVAAVARSGLRFGLAYTDVTTGEFRVTEVEEINALQNELARVDASEILISDEDEILAESLPKTVAHDGFAFLYEHAFFLLKEHFKVQSLDGFGCSDLPLGVAAAGALLHYITQQLRQKADHLTALQSYRNTKWVELGRETQEHLELVQSHGIRNMSLLKALDRTVTPMGARRLRDWILHPLRDKNTLEERGDVVEGLLADAGVLSDLRDALRAIRDMERTVGRLSQTSGNARDLVSLKISLQQIPALKKLIQSIGKDELLKEERKVVLALVSRLNKTLREFPELIQQLESALTEEPPATIKEGGMFRDGFDANLDTLRSASADGKKWLLELQKREIERTGVKSLKVRYNSVFGYFIELTKSNLGNVPEDYVRKQTMANAERFITPELKEMEGKILGADERSRTLETELFYKLREAVLVHLPELQAVASTLAVFDVLSSFAETARLFGYCRPHLSEDSVLEIIDGRHPVLDQNIAEEKFVPNDTLLDGNTNRLLILTGPNMAGKSTFIRQVALIVLMAQIGSFVPAGSAEIGLVDRIFTRVGASDDLSRGQSTFMVEMNETANIVNNATAQSLIILDEIGRGTSTFDGLSIAWSVAEHLHDKVQARTLFATHYHELTDLAKTRKGVKNYNVAVREWNDQIIFLHKIIEGPADKSYGIQVARLAGLPTPLITRAKEILANLEQAELNAEGQPVLVQETSAPQRKKKSVTPDHDTPQLPLF